MNVFWMKLSSSVVNADDILVVDIVSAVGG